MGFLIEILDEKDAKHQHHPRRELISEEELLKSHSRDMYNYLKSTLRYEIKVPVKKSEMMSPQFDAMLEKINKQQSVNRNEHGIAMVEEGPTNNETPKISSTGKVEISGNAKEAAKLAKAKPIKKEDISDHSHDKSYKSGEPKDVELKPIKQENNPQSED
jgi:hypothetical protein